jgi:hypothetical protein
MRQLLGTRTSCLEPRIAQRRLACGGVQFTAASVSVAHGFDRRSTAPFRAMFFRAMPSVAPFYS